MQEPRILLLPFVFLRKFVGVTNTVDYGHPSDVKLAHISSLDIFMYMFILNGLFYRSLLQLPSHPRIHQATLYFLIWNTKSSMTAAFIVSVQRY